VTIGAIVAPPDAVAATLTAAVLLLGAARRWRLPYPVLLALTGAVVAIAPIDVSLHLDPALVLTLFVAPTLLASRVSFQRRA
jgi:NhaP-type Na+/H+ or K+/H+ antiporter